MSKDGLLLLWIIFIIIMMGYNYWKIERRKNKPDYLQQFFFKGGIGIIHATFLGAHWTWQTDLLKEWLPILLFQAASYWVIFNPSLNLFRNDSFWNLGKYSGWIDPFFIKRLRLYRIAYVLAVGGAVWSAIKILR